MAIGTTDKKRAKQFLRQQGNAHAFLRGISEAIIGNIDDAASALTEAPSFSMFLRAHASDLEMRREVMDDNFDFFELRAGTSLKFESADFVQETPALAEYAVMENGKVILNSDALACLEHIHRVMKDELL